MFFRQSNKSLYVFGQTESSKAKSSIEEVRADARIKTHGVRYFFHVAPEPLTEISNHVGIGDLQTEERVGGMLYQFGAGNGCHQKDRPRAGRTLRFVNGAVKPAFEKWLVDFAQLPLGFRILYTYNDAIRMEEVCNGSAFAQELGVGGDAEGSTSAAAIDVKSVAELFARLSGNCALFDDQLWRASRGGDLPGYIVNGGKIGFAGIERGRAHTDENRVGGASCLSA